MNNIFDELKQFVVKEIFEKITLNNQKYYNLEKNKKYLICYFNELEELIICQYAGYFCSIDTCHPGAYGDLSEGYYFTNNISDDFSSGLVGQYNNLTVRNYNKHKFYELENNFNQSIFKDIFNFVNKNLITNKNNELDYIEMGNDNKYLIYNSMDKDLIN